MRKTTIMTEKIIAFCLAFILGFFSAFGAIAGGIYYAYSTISVDMLSEWAKYFNINLPIDDYVNKDAEKPITSLSIEDLLKEIQAIQSSKLTIDEMINKYGLVIPADILDKLPDSVKSEIPFTFLFSEDGANYLMASITVDDIFEMIPAELLGTVISDPIRHTLKDHTLADIVALNYGYIFEGVQLGYLLGVTYELDENGVYQIVWADPEAPTVMELVAPLDLGGILNSVANNEGNLFEVIENSIGDVAIDALLGTLLGDASLISGLLGGTTLSDIIVHNPDTGEYTVDIAALLNDKKLGSLIGYTEIESIDPETGETVLVWTDANGNNPAGIMAVVADFLVTDLINGQISVDSLLNDLVIADLLGYERGEKLPVFMYDDLENPITLENEITIWYQGGVIVDKMMGAFADKSFTWISTSISELMLSDILGYCKYDGAWYSWKISNHNGSDIIELTPGDPIMSSIANTPVGNLGGVADSLKGIQIANILGFESVTDDNGEHLYWSSGTDDQGNPIKATGIMASIAGLSVNDLSDNQKLQGAIDGIRIADVLGFTEGSDGKWHDANGPVAGPMAALAGLKIGELSSGINDIAIGEILGYTLVYEDDVITQWVDGNGDKVEGIIGAFVDLSIGELSDGDKLQSAINGVTIANVLGLEERADGWYDGNGNKVTGIMASLAGSKVGELSSIVDTLTIADVLGLEERADGWYNGDNKVTGIMAALAGSKVGELSSVVDTLTIADVLGLEKKEDGWYDSNGDKATGIMAALADSTIGSLSSKIDTLKIADVLGLEEKEDGWYDSDGNKATGIMASLADSTIGELSSNVDDLTIADVLGLEKKTDGWYDSNNKKATGVMAALAGYKIGELSSAVEDLTIANVLGLEKKEDGWYDSEDVKTTGIMASLAGYKIGELSSAVDTLTIANVLGLEKKEDGWYDSKGVKTTGILAALAGSKIGELSSVVDTLTIADLLGLEKKEDGWYDSKGVKTTGILAALAGYKIGELSSAVDTLTIADVLGLEKKEDGWYDSEGVKTTGILAALASSTVGNLSEDINKISIGEMLGHTPVYVKDEQGNDTDVIDHWVDANGEKVDGIIGAFVGLNINDLGNSSIVQSSINKVTIADVLGLEKKSDGWYDSTGVKASGIMSVLAGSTVGNLSEDINKISIGEMLGHTPVYVKDEHGNDTDTIDYWVDANNVKVSGIIGAFVGMNIDDMSNNEMLQSSINKVTIAEVLGLEEREDGWYNSNNEKVSGIMVALAGTKIGELSSRMDNITIAEMLGLEKRADGWYNSDGTKASGIVAALANSSINSLNADLNNVKVGEILGYSYINNIWVDGNGQPVSGVTGALAGSTLSTLDADLNLLQIGEVAGYVKLPEGDPNGKWYYYDTVSGEYLEASGILAELSDLTVNDLTRESALTDKIGNVELAVALGYTKNPSTGKWIDKSGVELTGIMAVLADKPISGMSSAVNELTIGDIIPSENRTGLLSIIPANTNINNIGSAIDESLSGTSLQFFINNGLIEFDLSISSQLDYLCYMKGQKVNVNSLDNNEPFDKVKYPDKYPGYHIDKLTGQSVEWGDMIPAWRTKPLDESFNYLLGLFITG